MADYERKDSNYKAKHGKSHKYCTLPIVQVSQAV